MLRGKATESTFDTGGTPLVGQPPGVGARAGVGWGVGWDGMGAQRVTPRRRKKAGTTIDLSSGGNTCWSSSGDGWGGS